MLESKLHVLYKDLKTKTPEEIYPFVEKLIRVLQIQHSALLLVGYSEEARLSAVKAHESVAALLI